MVDEPGADQPPLVQRLLQRIQHEAGVGRTAHPPADDAPGERIDVRRTSRFDDECHVDEARPGTHVCEVRHPEHVRGRRPELAVDVVERARRRLVAHRGPHRLAADDASKPHVAHQPGHRAASNLKALPPQLVPHLAHAIDAEVLVEHALDLPAQLGIALGACGQTGRIGTPGHVLVVN